MTSTPPLPTDVFELAMASLRDVTEQRVRGLFNRHRAVFAEFVVSALLPGSSVEVDPSWPWDVTWPFEAGPVRIQVKCSGEVLPHNRPGKFADAEWKVERPTKAWDPVSRRMRAIDRHQCDVFVLARHIGHHIEAGWRFRVARSDQLPDGRWRPKQLDEIGVVELAPADLADTIRAAILTP